MARSLFSALTAVLLLAVAGFAASSGATASEEVHVDSADFYFCSPSFANGICETTITAGDTVVWDNIQGLHTVTQCDDAFVVCPPSGGFDSGFLNPGDTFPQPFDSPGTFPYWCSLHPVQMRGRIIVEAQDTPTPSPTPSPTPATTTQPGDTPTPSPGTTPADVPSVGGASDGDSTSGFPFVVGGIAIAVASVSLLTLVGVRRR